MYECAPADAYILGTFGSGGEVDAPSFGGEVGRIWPEDEPKYLLGLGVSRADSGKILERGWIFDKVRDNEWELYGAAGISFTKSLFVVGTAGYSVLCEGGVLKEEETSACSSWEGNDTEIRSSVSGQLRYVYKSLIIGGGYHNRRGIIIIGGIRFY